MLGTALDGGEVLTDFKCLGVVHAKGRDATTAVPEGVGVQPDSEVAGGSNVRHFTCGGIEYIVGSRRGMVIIEESSERV